MSNIEKYNEIFIRLLNIKPEQLNDKMIYQSVPAWDSVGHMTLIAELEDAFEIMLETDDIIDFSSYEKGQEILKKYGVEI